MRAGLDPAQPKWLGQNWPGPKLIILVVACRMTQPLAQSRHGALSNCQICSCRLPELASLGWCHVRLFASVPVKTIPRHRGMSGDQFRARFGKFGGR